MEHRYNIQDAILCDARVTITKDMEIKQADAEYYAFIGEKAAAFIFSRLVHIDDLPAFRKCVKYVHNKDESTFLTFRLLHKLGTYSWVVANISDYKGTIVMHITDVDMLFGFDQNKNPLAEHYSDLLDILDGYIMQYDLTTKELLITVPEVTNQLKIYNGPIDGWKEYMLSDGVIVKDDLAKFIELCNEMTEGAEVIKKKIRYNKLFGIEDIDSCIYRCKTITDSDGSRYVLGIIFVIKTKEAVEEFLVSDNINTSYKDFGTDIFNKRAITEYTTRLIESQPDYNIAIAIVDIDDFKIINDTYGHLFGDDVINQVANVIKRVVGHNGLCGRIGGDEMFIVMENVKDKDDMRGIFRNIKTDLRELYEDDEKHPMQLTCSIGCAMYPEDASNYMDLFNVADKMLYLAKEKGKNRYLIYRDELHHDYVYSSFSGENKVIKSVRSERIMALNAMIQYYQTSGNGRKRELLTNLCNVFNIDEIYIYDAIIHHFYLIYGNDEVEVTEYKYIDKENYLNNFNKDGIFVIDNIATFEGKSPEMYKLFTNVHLEQAVQYAMLHNGKVDVNTVVSFCRNTRRKKWSELEISSLGTMGCLIGNVYERYASALNN